MSRLKTPVLFRLAAPAACAALALALTSAPAHATGLSVTAGCGPSGNGRWFCNTSASGGTGTYSYTYTAVLNASVTSARSTFASGTCDPGSNSEVDVTVTDSAGNTGSDRGFFYCGAPQ